MTSNLDRASAKSTEEIIGHIEAIIPQSNVIEQTNNLPPTRGLNTDPPNSAQTPIP